ncbi:hypothetical protein A1Q1_08302 [Trichosporon asahii var. asahii CBS 2479]|uniref:C2H2-type domain-containing protein n=1 Tax=Trichosporon asahii var. asahii (strain ATCC 90039 / CBS 2479 / JCM 2466 / KCTC 7840 / NBRC 103889/ NCYC 2677 / UAMH 7654) TaxID=1186058 RepID=J4UGK9_TRIAS|nr:hypothetical protein A1Q1_08302 [Trichosporon asahii var. asahii CBS 2479]EJT50600.1 hypothetical protein A1Q1_08302 [Trichosporon asahii var. asahii CBS 2479]
MKSRGMHVQRAHPTAALHTCALGCGFESDNSKTNLNHEEKAHVDGPDAVICRICEIIYTNSRMLTNHLKREHGIEEPWACVECPYRSGDMTSLKNHVCNVHEPTPDARCGICGCKGHGRLEATRRRTQAPGGLVGRAGDPPVVQVVDDGTGNLQISQALISPAGRVSSTAPRDLAVHIKTITANGQVKLSPATPFSQMSTAIKLADNPQYKLSTKAGETNPKQLFFVSYAPDRLTEICQ